jgi:tRNA threonylcarbamoyladenosine biosynthesis protein TsaB
MGPGSFTGVRIACGVAQGLALGANLPVVGIVTLQALAQAAGRNKVIAAIDARMGEIYHAAYQKINGEWQTVIAPNLCQAAQAPLVTGDDWFGCGTGFAQVAEPLATRYAGQIMAVDASMVPRASAIAQLAAPIFAAGGGVDAAFALPFYLRDKVALKTHEREQAKLDAAAAARIAS